MQQNANPSLDQLKRETEQTRAGLTQTVELLRTSVSETAEDIRQRLSPESIKSEVSDYVRSRGERLVEDVSAAARRNPLQAAAVGVGIAYPLLRLARAIPMPVILVGAGLFFAGSKTGQSALHKASDMAADLSDDVRRRSQDLADQVGESVGTVQSAASEAISAAGQTLSSGANRLRNAAGLNGSGTTSPLRDGAAALTEEAIARGRDLSDNVVDLVGSTGDRMRNIASDASSATQTAIGATRDAAVETAKDFSKRASAAYASRTAIETIERNPLLVAGVGLFLGGLIASALPRSDVEDSLVGDASASVKKQTRDAASNSFDAVNDAAGEIFENVARKASAEGLVGEGFDAAAKDIGQRVRRVADAVVTTAFEPKTGSTPPVGVGEHHD